MAEHIDSNAVSVGYVFCRNSSRSLDSLTYRQTDTMKVIGGTRNARKIPWFCLLCRMKAWLNMSIVSCVSILQTFLRVHKPIPVIAFHSHNQSSTRSNNSVGVNFPMTTVYKMSPHFCICQSQWNRDIAVKKVKQSHNTPMEALRRRGGIAPTHSWRRQEMGVSGQRHAPVAFYPRGKDPTVPIG
jgi:hypothetical protein